MMCLVQTDPAEQLPDRLTRLERVLSRDLVPPAWRRQTPGESRWPSGLAILCMIGLQYMLPERLSLGPRWALPAVELLLIVVLAVGNPRRIERSTPVFRMISLVFTGVAGFNTSWSVVLLVLEIARRENTGTAAQLLAAGGDVYLINVLTFAVWFWELDRGGPVQRALGAREHPDLLFPQMTAPDMAPKDWEPRFGDYLYVALTNSTAFSPTDTLPLTRWAKGLFAIQSVVSLVTAALVIAKAVNALA